MIILNESISEHFKKHKTKYIIGGAALAGAVAPIAGAAAGAGSAALLLQKQKEQKQQLQSNNISSEK